MKKIGLLLIPMAFLASCAAKSNKGEAMQNDYVNALQDSIAAAQHAIDSCENQLSIETDQVDEWLRDFTVVDNPREVEHFYIFQGWQKRYPLQNTGIVARISNGETLELIAALKNGTFDSITAEAGEATASTAVVPNDQALNYRRDGLTTVMFSGPEADAVAKLIADNELNKVTIIFKQSGKVKSSWQMPDDYKKMITATSLLYTARCNQMSLENGIKLYNTKLRILRNHLEAKQPQDK